MLSGRAAGEIARSLRAMIVRPSLDAKAAMPVVKCASYLVKNARWLHYSRGQRARQGRALQELLEIEIGPEAIETASVAQLDTWTTRIRSAAPLPELLSG